MKTLTRIVLVLILAALTGCPAERPPAFDRDRLLLGPIPLKDRLAWVDSALDRVVALDFTADRPAVLTRDIGRSAVYAAPTPDRARVLVITRGEEALERGQVDEPPQLWDIDLEGGNPPRAYQVGSPFDRIAVSADGSLAVTYFSQGGPDDHGFFRNPNELAFINLAQEPSPTNPVLKTVRSFGSTPTGIMLSPPMAVPGAADAGLRTFAFVLAQNVVTIVDATHPERIEASIRLDVDGGNVMPREVVFAPLSATAYLRSDGARDVLEVVLANDPPVGGPLSNDFRPVLAELGAGSGPADIAIFDDIAQPDRRWVLAATPGTREVVVIDADTAEFRKVDVPDPVDRIVLFPGDRPTVAVLAAIGRQIDRVHLLPLTRLSDELALLDVETIQVGQPVRDVVPVPGSELAMLVHDDDRTVLGLLDLTYGSVSPLQGVGRLDSYAFTASGEYLVGTTRQVARVGFLELANLHPTDLRLDTAPTAIFALANGKLVADHGAPAGHVTILPGPGAGRDEAQVLDGFLLAGILDQEP